MLRRTICALAAALCLLAPTRLFAQIIDTVVGNAINNNRPALQTPLVRPQGIAFDNNGDLIIADRGNYVIRRVSKTSGVSSVIAGGGTLLDDAVPVPGTQAALLYPTYLAVDAVGNIYFSDTSLCRVRKIRTDGTVQNVAGVGFCGYFGDGDKATLAAINFPTGVAVDRSRNMLYIADYGNQRVRRVNLTTGIIDTYAGNGTQGTSGDGGPATQASLFQPVALAVDAAGNLFISDGGYDVSGNPAFAIRKVSINGTITIEVPRTVGLNGPSSLAFDQAGRLFIAAYYNNVVVRVDAGGNFPVIAGGGSPNFPQENSPATAAYLGEPNGIAFDSGGNLNISEDHWHLVRRVDASSGLIRTVAGTADLSVLDGGQAINAPLANAIGIAFNATGSFYVADQFHERIRRVDPNGTIRTVAGNGYSAASPDGSVAASSSIWDPFALFVENNGNVLYTEAYSVVRRLNVSTGRISTVAGVMNNQGFNGGSGPALNVKLNIPYAAVSDSAGNVYISDRNNSCIRKVTPAGNLTAIAGNCNSPGYFGDGVPATQALMAYPTGLAFDRKGDLLISDSGNSVVRRLNLSTGIISLVAGIPQFSFYSGDFGLPNFATLGSPTGLTVDPRDGTIYIVDDTWSVVRMIRNGLIFTVAGTGWPAFYGDGGEARFAFLNLPEAVAVDASGNLFIVDSNNNRVRKVEVAGAAPPALSVTPGSLSFRVTQGAEASPPQTLFIRNAGSGFLTWQLDPSSGPLSGGLWLLANLFGGSAPSLVSIGIDTSVVTPGTYQGRIIVNAAGASGSPVTIPVTLTVDPPVNSSVALSNSVLYYEAVQGGAAPPARILTVTNGGSGTLNWQASRTTFRGGNWLSLSSTSGSVQAGSAANAITVTANPTGLAPGFYVGLITVTNQSSGGTQTVAVGLFISNPAATILLSASSFSFTVVQGSNFIPAQTFRVLNVGQGLMNWQIQTTLSQGNWLRVSPTFGVSDAANQGNSPTVTLNADPSSLGPGIYGGLLQIQSSGARNSPQPVTVTLRVLPPGSPPVPSVQPAGLTFSGTAGSAAQTQEVAVTSTGGGALTFGVGTRIQNGSGWMTASPTGGSLTSSSDQPKIRVTVTPGSLAVGVYRGAVTLSFSNGEVREVGVALILRPVGTTTLDSGEKQAVCPAGQQVVQSIRLGNNFALPTGWPATIIAVVTDNCGNVITNSTVSAAFSNGDATLIMQNLGSGVYSKDWVPSRTTAASTPVQVSLRAVNPVLQESILQLTGTVSSDSTFPAVFDNGVSNGASFAAGNPVSPGSIVSIFGNNLGTAGSCSGGNCPANVPLPTSLGGASVKIGGIDAPLFYAGPGQINAQVPFELSGVSSADVVVTTRGVFSGTRTIQLDNNQPGIFNLDGTRGAVLVSNTDILALPSGSVPGRNARPANRGEFITIYCTGLGTVNNPPASGSAAGSSPLSRATTPVTVSIGGVSATNIGFAGLSPGFVGLYQVDVQVPFNAPTGSSVTLKITQNGIDSNQVTIAVN